MAKHSSQVVALMLSRVRVKHHANLMFRLRWLDWDLPVLISFRHSMITSSKMNSVKSSSEL